MDYTSLPALHAYDDSTGTKDDTLLSSLITAMSGAVDQYCNQTLGYAVYTLQPLRGLVDADGVLTCYPPVPTIASITAADYRVTTLGARVTLDPTQLEIDAYSSGTVVRVTNASYSCLRGSRIQMRLSYTGGWANLAAVPADVELAVRRLAWWAYKKRSTPIDTTAMPDLGTVVIPGSWPSDIKLMLTPYVRQIVQ